MALMDERLNQFLRFQNIFNPEPSPTTPDMGVAPNPTFDIPQPEQQEDPYAARMRQLYQPETAMTDRYTEALDDMPTRNKPGILRKILGGVTALSGEPDRVKRALYGPYDRQLEDWKTKIDPLQNAANLERQNNANLRMVANQILSSEYRDKNLQRMTGRDQVLETQGNRRLDQGDVRNQQGQIRLDQGQQRVDQGWDRNNIARERNKIAAEIGKGGVFEIDDFGNSFIVRRDGSKIPVEGEYLSFEEKSKFLTERAKSVAEAREGEKRDRVALRPVQHPDGTITYEAINLDEAISKPVTGQTGSTIAPPKSELEVGRGDANRAEQVMNSNPRWSKWIKIKPGGIVEIERPSWHGMSGPSKEEYDQISAAIYPSSVRKPPGNVNPPANVPNQNQNKVKVRRKSDGATGTMDANDPKLNSGLYERIQ